MNKQWWKSLTIISQIIIGLLVAYSVWMIASIPALRYEFTTDELCDWAYSMSRALRLVIVQMLIVSCALIGIYGRKRAKGGIGKNEKE